MEGENEIANPFDECHTLSPEDTEELLNYYNRDILTEFVGIGPKKYFLYKELQPISNCIYNMEVRPSDTYVVTFPRSGTTWTQEMVWLLQHDLDFEKAKSIPLVARFPFLESPGFLNLKSPSSQTIKGDHKQFIAEIAFSDPEVIKNAPAPRLLKTHLPISLMPPSLIDTAKVVYVARDPRDAAISNYFHFQSYQIIPKDAQFKPFWKFFMESKVPWSPYFEHLKEAWRLRNHPNMIFLFYEELSKDLAGVAKRLAKFFGKQYSDEQIEALCNHLKFDNFKKNESVNMSNWAKAGLSVNFIRKGKSGGWREHFDEEMTQQADQWIADNLRDTDLRFPQVN